jgi:hypothetical protein
VGGGEPCTGRVYSMGAGACRSPERRTSVREHHPSDTIADMID